MGSKRRARRRQRILIAALGAAAAFFAVAAYADAVVREVGAGGITSVADAPCAPVAIVPGAGLRPDGGPSAILEDRLAAAVELYRRRKVSKLLLSGDHGTRTYDEPAAMAWWVEEEGVPPEDIFLDHAGFDTHATLYRARHVFGITRALVVTQEFHLARALYFARRVGIEASGVRADRRLYERRTYYAVREAGARVKALIVTDVLHARPRFLGPRISMDGDGRVTRDGD